MSDVCSVMGQVENVRGLCCRREKPAVGCQVNGRQVFHSRERKISSSAEAKRTEQRPRAASGPLTGQLFAPAPGELHLFDLHLSHS